MNFYTCAKAFLDIRNKRIKLLTLAAAHLTGMRYIGIFLDPVMACNLRCRMCYFSDPAHKPAAVKPMTPEYIASLKKSLFPRALKLQIGCGAEPTLYSRLPELVAEAHKAGIPHIEITSNGQLLDLAALTELAKAGLDGLTLSLHGTTRDTYEYLMTGASYDKLLSLIASIAELRKSYPDFKLRINYTFNNLNVSELTGLWDLFGDVRIDMLQIRPIQKLGDTDYHDFDLSDVHSRYSSLIAPVKEECHKRGVLFVGPEPQNLLEVNDRRDHYDSLIEEITYCYVSPGGAYHSDFDLAADTFDSYHRRRGTLKTLLRYIFCRNSRHIDHIRTSKKMNYKIS